MSFWQGLLVGSAVFLVTTVAVADVTKLALKVEGMTPTGCSSPPAIQGTVRGFSAVRGVDVSLERSELVLEYEAGELDLERLITTVERMCLVKITRPPVR